MVKLDRKADVATARKAGAAQNAVRLILRTDRCVPYLRPVLGKADKFCIRRKERNQLVVKIQTACGCTYFDCHLNPLLPI